MQKTRTRILSLLKTHIFSGWPLFTPIGTAQPPQINAPRMPIETNQQLTQTRPAATLLVVCQQYNPAVLTVASHAKSVG